MRLPRVGPTSEVLLRWSLELKINLPTGRLGVSAVAALRVACSQSVNKNHLLKAGSATTVKVSTYPLPRAC
jgi:hypothetical protein